jgi:hypothetical protein
LKVQNHQISRVLSKLQVTVFINFFHEHPMPKNAIMQIWRQIPQNKLDLQSSLDFVRNFRNKLMARWRDLGMSELLDQFQYIGTNDS